VKRLLDENKRKRVECNSFYNSPWIATIDNNGNLLVLHHVDSVKLVPRTSADDKAD
jgi:hypothetical protein